MLFIERGRRLFKIIFIIIFLSISILGCEKPIPKGHYEGSLSLITQARFSNQPVSLDVTYRDRRSGVVEIKDMSGKLITILTLNATHTLHPELRVPNIQIEPFYLKKKTEVAT
jgi:hypothetical protein